MKNPWAALRGYEQPSVIFGLYCILGTAILAMLLGMLVMTMADQLPERLFEILGILYLAYVVWAHISLWTCASNAKRRAWRYAARVYAAAILAIIAGTLLWPYFAAVGPIEVRQIQ
jgi:threonine/homoserine/homoserine lactone efflux protein